MPLGQQYQLYSNDVEFDHKLFESQLNIVYVVIAFIDSNFSLE